MVSERFFESEVDAKTLSEKERDSLDVETNVVSGNSLNKLLVVHLDGLDLGGDVGRSEAERGENESESSVSCSRSSKSRKEGKEDRTYLTTIPALMIPVSTRPTGTVPIPPIL